MTAAIFISLSFKFVSVSCLGVDHFRTVPVFTKGMVAFVFGLFISRHGLIRPMERRGSEHQIKKGLFLEDEVLKVKVNVKTDSERVIYERNGNWTPRL